MATIAVAILSFAVIVQAAVLLYTYRNLQRSRAEVARCDQAIEFWRLNVKALLDRNRELEAEHRRQADGHDAELVMIARMTERLFVTEGMERND